MGRNFDNALDRRTIARCLLPIKQIFNFLKWLESYRLKLMERAGKPW